VATLARVVRLYGVTITPPAPEQSSGFAGADLEEQLTTGLAEIDRLLSEHVPWRSTMSSAESAPPIDPHAVYSRMFLRFSGLTRTLLNRPMTMARAADAATTAELAKIDGQSSATSQSTRAAFGRMRTALQAHAARRAAGEPEASVRHSELNTLLDELNSLHNGINTLERLRTRWDEIEARLALPPLHDPAHQP
jgi:hypothetical protein